MNKKILIGIIVAVVIIGVFAWGVVELLLHYPPWVFLFREKEKPISLELMEIDPKNIFFLSLGIFLSAAFLAILISFYFSKKITGPLEKLRRGAEIIGEGNLKHRIEIKTGGEIEKLANSFNQMAENLSQSYADLEEVKVTLETKVAVRTKELRDLTENLDEEVKQRTKELQERIDELEKIHRLAVGRELKMLELKKEIKKIKERKG